MNKKDFNKLIENYKTNKDYLEINNLLEKQIICCYSEKLINKIGKFTFRNRLRMLEEIEQNLDIEDAVNFRNFFEVTSNTDLAPEDLFDELETIYSDIV